ncbi:EF-hand domain-containing protein [Sphingomonas sp. Leaf242]|uniref:EF-hand domain-containing protein n=1 Tax=Sphingomonas sp. Leaf242 TaxID=1736304 RepID=UPI0009EBA076|nr:EF-hand domain-containing protein [Sphingomonas sp. Leaf242]
MQVKLVTALAATGIMVSACGDKDAQRAQADANAVGFVPPSVTSRLDFGASLERRFRTLDRNGDDRITKDELPSPNSRIRAFDRNKDGVITAIEWSEGTLAWFDKMDLNHDGTVTSEERTESRNR